MASSPFIQDCNPLGATPKTSEPPLPPTTSMRGKQAALEHGRPRYHAVNRGERSDLGAINK